MSYSDDESKESAGSSPAPFRPIIPDVSHIDMNKLSRQPEGPDFIPYNKRGRDIMSRTFQLTGICWLGGFSAGGVLGFMEGWRYPSPGPWACRYNDEWPKVLALGQDAS